jgi:membrane-associated phospholipid phosphatase
VTTIDRTLYRAVNRFADHTSWAHGIFRFIAQDGIVLFALLLVIGWWIGRSSEAPLLNVSKAIWAGAGPLLALAINQPIGSGIGRARPYMTIANMHLLVDRTKDFSFPSDHATIAGGVAAGLFLLNRRLGLVTLIAAFVMAFARVYVGAHYPGDVLAGLVLGAAVTVGLTRFGTGLTTLVVGALAKTPLRPVLTPTRPMETSATTDAAASQVQSVTLIDRKETATFQSR